MSANGKGYSARKFPGCSQMKGKVFDKRQDFKKILPIYPRRKNFLTVPVETLNVKFFNMRRNLPSGCVQ